MTKMQGRPQYSDKLAKSNKTSTTELAAPRSQESLYALLKQNKNKLERASSGFIKFDDLTRLSLIAASRQPQILECTSQSIIRALMDACLLKIKPGGLMGRGYLVPRRNKHLGGALELHFDPGYRGLADIARRTGVVKSLTARVVYEGEQFEVVYGTDEKLVHKPTISRDTNKVVAAYAVAVLQDGQTQFEVLTRADLTKIRASSSSKNQQSWNEWEDEMSRKSAIRRLTKHLPFPELMDIAMEISENAHGMSVSRSTQQEEVEKVDVQQVVEHEQTPVNEDGEVLVQQQVYEEKL